MQHLKVLGTRSYLVHTKPYIESKAFLYSGTQTQGFSRFKINMVGIQKIVTRRLRIQA